MKKLNPAAEAYTPQFPADYGGGHSGYSYGHQKPNTVPLHVSSHRPHLGYKPNAATPFIPMHPHTNNPQPFIPYPSDSSSGPLFGQYSPQNSFPSSVAPFVPPQPKENPIPRVILVSGYEKMGKTTVANRIAEKFDFEYINVRKRENSSSCIDLVKQFSPLKEALIKLEGKKGIVIDDATHGGRYQPYYIAHLLEHAPSQPLHINGVFTITTELKDVPGRATEGEIDKQSHPEGFEFCAALEDENDSQGIMVLDSSLKIDQMLEDCDRQMKEFLSAPAINLKLPEVSFIPNALLVTDLELVEKIIQAEATELQTTNCNYLHTFPYVLPDFILEYSLFAKMALLFQNYLLLPWTWEEKISIIGYANSVYVHVATHNLLFELNDAPGLQKLSQSTEISEASSPLKFSLEAIMKHDKIYISDMMYLAGSLGSEKTLRERVKLLQDHLGDLNDPNIALLKHFPVNEIQNCIKEYKSIALGVVFIHPDGMRPGTYDNRNIVFYCAEEKRLPLRLWNGVEDDNGWTFDGYTNEGSEDIHPSNLRVVIPKDIVEKNGLNNGHIVECVPENVKRKLYRFVKRYSWDVMPAAQYFFDNVMKQAVPPDVFIKACVAMNCKGVAE